MLRPGGNVDSWCGKCKMLLAHTIEAMVGDRPARVHCNTCKSPHGYKPHAPGEAGTAPRAPAKPRSTRYQTLLKGKDMAEAKTYSPRTGIHRATLCSTPASASVLRLRLKMSRRSRCSSRPGQKYWSMADEPRYFPIRSFIW